jgi:hypothetical protein
LLGPQIELAICFWTGSRCDQSKEEAFKWALIGEQGGDPRGEQARAMMEADLDESAIQGGLSRAQAYLAQKHEVR